ncbi:hypothetical protein DEI97_013540 [Curtobacterium sp. MCLR17_032]|uniref:hypothetical protein n=1 Tax=Curtobacterium sp. MCLR17_032 TaxID=2175650 RepID=UPI0011B80231|nr:hypothetical protein [Curtobacterium sp. MCLR17_032]WIE60764.1 hypothetical protein DEI97_013540 [Curtobacterium sp. MCLR17_032]
MNENNMENVDQSRNTAEAQIDWRLLAWTSSIAAHAAWRAGYAAGKEQYGGFSIELDRMARAMYEAATPADALPWEALRDEPAEHVLEAVQGKWLLIARSALDYIEKQADA